LTKLNKLCKIVNIMKKLIVSSTELKRKTSKIINLVGFGKTIAIVEKYGQPLVKITPVVAEKETNLKEKADKYFGAIPDFPSVSKNRNFRKRNTTL